MIKKLLRETILRPISWTQCAVALAIIFAVLHVLGWRVDTSIISGTLAPNPDQSKYMILRGLFYGLTYFAAVVLAPILILAAGISRLFAKPRQAKSSDSPLK